MSKSSVITRYKKAYFFDTPASEAGDRFNTKNLPTRESFEKLMDSVAFVSESVDGARTGQQGLIKIQLDDDSISKRYSPDSVSGDAKAAQSHQFPGVGVLSGSLYQEPMYQGSDDARTGSGIKVTALKKVFGSVEKISYQVEMDGSSLPNITAESAHLKNLVYVANTNTIGLTDLTIGGGTGNDFYFSRNYDIPATVWIIPHHLGNYPNIGVMIGDQIVCAEIVHDNINNARVIFSTQQIGKVICS